MRLLREWIRVILEGYKQDQETLIKKHPDYRTEIQQMNPKMIGWFIRRFGNTPSVKETHPFEDCIPTVQKYEGKAAGLSQKYRTNEYFRSLVDRKFPEKTWSNLADYVNMTVDQMEGIMGLSERKKPRFDMEGNEPDHSDFLGKFGPWNLWMPNNRENSVKIAGYDPETLEPKTTWCTARVTGSNLFYSYVGHGIILFYVIKDNPQKDKDWLSVGFINGKPDLRGRDGGITIDRDNKGLTEEKLRSILGGYYDRLMTVMQEKVGKLKGEHPAKKKIEEAAQSLPAYNNLIKGLGNEETRDLKITILRQKNVSPEILTILADDDNIEIRKEVASNPNTPAHILENLSNDEAWHVRLRVAENPNTPAHILENLSNDEAGYVRLRVAENPNTPVHILEKLSDDESSDMKQGIAGNPNTPVHILEKFGNEDDVEVEILRNIARNPNTPAHVLEKLSDDDDEVGDYDESIDGKYDEWSVKDEVAFNPNTPVHILEKLSKDKDFFVRMQVTRNRNVPARIVKNLLNDEVEYVRKDAKDFFIATDPSTTAETLGVLLRKSDFNKQYHHIAKHPNATPVILDTIAKNTNDSYTLLTVIRNPNTSLSTLEKLSTIINKKIAEAAQQMLVSRQQQLAELRKLIYNLI